jgi:hypothetical protein
MNSHPDSYLETQSPSNNFAILYSQHWGVVQQIPAKQNKFLLGDEILAKGFGFILLKKSRSVFLCFHILASVAKQQATTKLYRVLNLFLLHVTKFEKFTGGLL